MVQMGGGILEVITFSTTAQYNFQFFLQFISQQLNCLRDERFEFELIPRTPQQICLVCDKWPENLSRQEAIATFRHYLSLAVAQFIIEELEPILLKNMLIKDYHCTGEKLETVFAYCQELLYQGEDILLNDRSPVEERKRKIYFRVYQCLAEERIFDLIGFVQFRLQSYLQDLKELQEYALEEFVLAEAYQEFIRLLRQFVSVQETKIPLLHVLLQEGQRFFIYNEDKEEVTEREIEAYLKVWAGHNLVAEGMLLSTLIGMAPHVIILHTEDADFNVISTLKNIYQERLHICSSCPDCLKWKEKKSDRFNKAPTNK